MNIEIHRLTAELADDFFDFFDNRAFTDNSPQGPCYCSRFQMTKEQEKTERFGQVEACDGGSEGFVRALRQIAERQIKSGAMQGYLAFIDGVSIGWCNANDKANFPVESGNGARFHAPAEKREKVVACFEIARSIAGRALQALFCDRS